MSIVFPVPTSPYRYRPRGTCSGGKEGDSGVPMENRRENYVHDEYQEDEFSWIILRTMELEVDGVATSGGS